MYDALVFSGGSTKIPVHLGFIKAVLQKGIDPDTLCGNSAGSIVAASLACEFPYSKLRDRIMTMDFKRLGGLTIAQQILALINKNWKIDSYSILLQEYFGDIRFRDLQKDLHVVGHCLDDMTWRNFNKVDDPKMPVWLAVRISSNVPLLFGKVIYKGKVWVDGGISKDLPVDIAPLQMGAKYLAHMIVSSEDLDFENCSKLQLATAVIDQLTQANREESLRDNSYGDVIRTEYKKFFLDFDVSEAEKEDMIQAGYDNTIKFLEERGF